MRCAELVAPFADPRVGYVCGDVRFSDAGDNQEGVYWRYEMLLRRLESALRSVTGGNGAIYATRRESYLVVDPIMGHDLSFPFNMVKRGWLAVYAPAARATEKMVPSIEGEFARKRRMMSHGWPIVLRGGMLSPRGYDPLYALMIFSHRVLRYATAVPALDRPRHQPRAARARLDLRGGGGRPGGGAARRRAGSGGSEPSVPGRPLLRADHGVAGCRTVGLAGPRDRSGLGARRGDPLSKRALDLLIAVPAAAPDRAGGGAARLLIRLESKGAAIYRQTRVGLDGQPFEIFKLRTMIAGAEFVGAGLAIQQGDDRITRLGTWLRRYSLDELPNLWNVVRGDMSIVGPRPTIPVQVEQYTERQRGRLAVRPGITGWAQVNGRASLPWPERIELDLWYVEHVSLVLDLRILVATVGMVLGGKGLYKGESGGWHPPSAT